MQRKGMNYKDILKNAPTEYCQRAARWIGLTGQLTASKLRKEIVQMFLNPASLRNLTARLSSCEHLVLTMLAFSCGKAGVPFHLFNQKVNQMSRGWSNTGGEVLRTLAESGFIFTIAVRGMQYHYIIPEDLCRLLQEIFAQDVNGALRSPEKNAQACSQRWICADPRYFHLSLLCFPVWNREDTTRKHLQAYTETASQMF